MKAQVLLALFSAAVIAVVAVPLLDDDSNHLAHGDRLLEFNETSTRWVTREQLDAMLRGDMECPGFMDITDHRNLSVSEGIVNPPLPTKISHEKTVKNLIPKIDGDRLIATVTQLQDKKSRYYQSETGRLAAEWIAEQYLEAAKAAGRTDVTVTFRKHSWVQNSFRVRIPGSGPNAAEVVVIGSHIDSINQSDLKNAPGADDDASGTSTVLEVFRILIAAGYKPDRTVEFHGYAAEEVGLRGSQDIVADFKAAKTVVASMLQLDMTLYQAGGDTSVNFVTDYVSPDLTQYLRTLVEQYCSVKWQNTRCGYGCSDHASWNKGGYLSAFPFETAFNVINPAIHTSRDLVSNLNKAHGVEYTKLALAYVIEMAGEL